MVITFRTVLNTNAQVINVAVAYWDANGNGTVTDDVLAGQVPLGAMAQFGFVAVPIDSSVMLLMLTMLLAFAGAISFRRAK
jgi:hypothetical protein